MAQLNSHVKYHYMIGYLAVFSIDDNASDRFDRLSELYQEDPEQFEKVRQQLLNDAFEKMAKNGTPNDRIERYKAALWQQDQVLNKYKNEITRFNRLVELFYEQVKRFEHIGNSYDNIDNSPKSEILEFKRKNDD